MSIIHNQPGMKLYKQEVKAGVFQSMLWALAVARCAEALALAEKLLPAALHEVFGEAKNKFESKEFGEAARLVRGPFRGSLKKEIFIKSGDCVYEQGNVIDNDLEKFRYFITPKKFEQMKRFAVSSGDILMSCSGTIGRFVIIPKDFRKEIINQVLLKISPNEKVSSQYLKVALENYIAENTSHVMGSAMKNIVAVSELKKIKIPPPSLAEQKQIVKRLNSLSEKVRTLKELQAKQSADLKALKQAILREVFT